MNIIKLIVGLANPGPMYEHTRHNAGAWYLTRLAQHYHTPLKKTQRFHGYSGEIRFNERIVYLLQPNIFMNTNGIAVASMANFYKISPKEILIAHDELDIPPGSIRLKYKGGHAGHNGIKSIINYLGKRDDFYRLRIGIGRPQLKHEVVNFVLGCAPTLEQKKIDQIIEQAINVTEPLLNCKVDIVMNILHTIK